MEGHTLIAKNIEDWCQPHVPIDFVDYPINIVYIVNVSTPRGQVSLVKPLC